MTENQHSPKICETCRNEIPAHSPAGMCPFCTMQRVSRSLVDVPFENSELSRPEIDGYDMGGLLGIGGMGEVYLATDLKFDRVVAIKVVKQKTPDDADEQKARFFQEVKALSALTHPSIVTILDVGETRMGDPFFSMEYVEGTNLRDRLREGAIPRETILKWAIQICEALHYAHENGIVHRDIKPANVLVSKDGYIKLVDFGLAKLLPEHSDPQLSLTFSQVAVGTPDYVAPEQIRHSQTIDHRADIYAVGVLLYEMATMQIPRGSWRKVSQINPDFSKVFDQLLNRTLAPDPDERFQTIQELQSMLETVPSPASMRKKRKIRNAVLSFTAAICLLVALSPVRASLPAPWGTKIPEYRQTPLPMANPPYNRESLANNPIATRPSSFPLEVKAPPGVPRLSKLDGRNPVTEKLPDNIDPGKLHLINWISPNQFFVPGKDDGIVRVSPAGPDLRTDVFLEGLTDIVQLEATPGSGLALRSDGKVFAWPAGMTHDFIPPGDLSKVVKVAAGRQHAVALLVDGSIEMWGSPGSGKLDIPYPFDNIVDVDAGDHFTAVLTKNGRVFAWGENSEGQCNVPENLPPVASITCLEDSLYVLFQNGLVRGWGKSGVTPSTYRPTLYRKLWAPSSSAALLGETTAGEWKVIAGREKQDWSRIPGLGNAFHRITAATITGNRMLHWQRSPENATSEPDPSAKLISFPRESPVGSGVGLGSIPALAESVVRFEASFTSFTDNPNGHVVALTSANELVSWGRNKAGQCTPPEISGRIIDLAAGDRFTAALTEDGGIVIWGANDQPKDLVPISHLHFVMIDAGSNHGVALDKSGRFFGWGNNTRGQLDLPDGTERFRLLTAEGHSTMAVTKTGKIQLWGDVELYNRGEIPAYAQEAALTARKIGLSGTTCWILDSEDTLHGWGNVKKGALPDIKRSRSLPRRVPNVADFWCDETGLIVRGKNGEFRGFEVNWSDEELTKRLSGATDIEITERQIFATVR